MVYSNCDWQPIAELLTIYKLILKRHTHIIIAKYIDNVKLDIKQKYIDKVKQDITKYIDNVDLNIT